MQVIGQLAQDYPQLYLNPDTDPQEAYSRVVRRGEEPEQRSLAHYTGDPADCLETMDTPAGPVRVATLGCRRDFELVIRGLMAAKSGPRTPVPQSQGAAMLRLFNWPRINARLAQFPPEEQAAEFKRFTSVPENYIDQLVVLSRGPYSGVPAEKAGYPEEEWLALSDTIRRYHELTHAVCRRRWPEDVDPLRDELIADAVGLAAAVGRFDTDLEKLFLGIRDGRYIGGRLGNYTDRPEEAVPGILEAMERMKEITDAHPGIPPFGLIPLLMER